MYELMYIRNLEVTHYSVLFVGGGAFLDLVYFLGAGDRAGGDVRVEDVRALALDHCLRLLRSPMNPKTETRNPHVSLSTPRAD